MTRSPLRHALTALLAIAFGLPILASSSARADDPNPSNPLFTPCGSQTADPKPVQPGGPPVWFAGTLGGRNLSRIVRLGRGWIPIMGATPHDVTIGSKKLRELFVDAHRDPAELQVRAGATLIRAERGFDTVASVAASMELHDAGATEVNFPMSAFVRDAADVEHWLDELIAAWKAPS